MARGLISTAALATILAATALNQSAVHSRTDLADSHLFAYYGWCLTQGATPYLDVWDNKPPGIWYANAAAITCAGPHGGADVLLGSVALLLALTAFLGITRALYHPDLLLPAAVVGGVILTDVRFEAGGNRTETFVLAFESLAVFAYVTWLHRRTWPWLVLCGAAALTAPLFKQSGVAAGAACVFHLAWLTWRSRPPAAGAAAGGQPLARAWLALAGGATLPPLSAAVILAAQGALGEAFSAVISFNRAYFAVHDATWVTGPRVLRLFATPLAWLAPPLAAAALGLAWAAVAHARTRQPPPVAVAGGVALLVTWLLLAFYLAAVGPGRQPYHLVPILAPTGLLALLPLHALARRAGLGAGVLAHPSRAVLVVVFAWLVVHSAAGNGAAMARCWRQKPRWYALPHATAAGFRAQAAVIHRLCPPGERIYVFGWSPGSYRAACRLPASRHATWEKLGQVAPHAEFIRRRAVADLLARPPRVILISTNEYDPVGAPVDNLGAWLQSHYAPVDIVNGMHILQLRSSVPPT